jgi:HK97 family phage major capsid protein
MSKNKDKSNDGKETPKLRWVKLSKAWENHPEGERIQLAAQAADDLVKQGVANDSKDPTKKAISKAIASMAGEIGKKISEHTDAALKEMTKAIQEVQKKAHKPFFGPNGTTPQPVDYPGLDEEGKSFGDFLHSVYKMYCGEGQESKDGTDRVAKVYGSIKAPLAEAAGVTGGYTVPTEYSMRLLQVAIQSQIVQPRATVLPISGRSIFVPALDHTTAPVAGTSAFLAGVIFNWTEEAQTRVETEPLFKQIELIAHELSGYSKVSNTLLADNAISLDSVLTQIFGKGIGWTKDYNFLQGNGAGKPMGIINAPCTLQVTRSGHNLFALADAANMLGSLLISSMSSAVWIMSQTLIQKMIQMVDGSGHVVWIPNVQSPMGGMAQTIPLTLLGLPIFFSEKLPALGSIGDVILADLQYYLIGERSQLEIAMSPHVAFLNNQMTYRVLSRLDGKPWLDNKITLADLTTTVSPFVVLTAP